MKTMTRCLLIVAIIALSMPSPDANVKAQDNPPTQPSTIYAPLVMQDSGLLTPIVPETTNVLSEESSDNLISISPDGSVFTFDQNTPTLTRVSPGEIIVSAPSPAAPHGYLRKVTTISDASGNIVFRTEQASLEEALEQGSIEIHQQLRPEQTQQQMQLDGVALTNTLDCNGCFELSLRDVVLYDFDNSNTTTDDRVLANGNIQIIPTIDFSFTQKSFRLQNLSFSYTQQSTTNLKISVGGVYHDTWQPIDVDIAKFALAPITVMVGPVPVVYSPVLTVKVGGSGRVFVGVTAETTMHHEVNGVLNYSSGKWFLGSSHKNSFANPSLNPAMDVEFKAYVAPELLLHFYGVSGPFAQARGYLKLQTSAELPLSVKLFGGIEMPIGVKVEILSKKLANYEQVAIRWEKLLQEYQVENHPPTSPANPAPADGLSDLPEQLTLSWTGGDIDNESVYYDLYLEPGDNTPDVLVARARTDTNFSVGPLEHGIQYYWQVVATDAKGNQTRGPVWNFVVRNNPWDDEFNQSTLSSKWIWVNENPTKWSLSTSEGFLKIYAVPGDMAQACNNFENLLVQKMQNSDFELITRLMLNPSMNYQQGGLAIFGSENDQVDTDNYVKLDILWNSNFRNSKSVEFLWEEQGKFPSTQWNHMFVSQTSPGYLKLTKRGSIYSGSYSSDGTNWINVGSRTVTGISGTSIFIGLFAFGGLDATSCSILETPEIPVDFDYFHVRK